MITEEAKIKTTELRLKIDLLSNMVKELYVTPPILSQDLEKDLDEEVFETLKMDFFIDHVKKSYEFLIYAKAWLGKSLSYLDNPSESPYTNDGKRNTVSDIEAVRADVNNSIPVEYEDMNEIQKIDFLRESIKEIINIIQDWNNQPHGSFSYGREYSICRTNAFSYLCEARFALGFELGEIRDDYLKV